MNKTSRKKIIGYVIHILALVIVYKGGTISWKFSIPPALILVLLYWGQVLLKTKPIKYLFATIAVIALGAYLLLWGSIFYVVRGGFRDYQKFCSNYIPLLEKYYEDHGRYPENLSVFDKPKYYPRHGVSDCGYHITDRGYNFFAPAGFGVLYYSSEDGKWVHD